MVFRAPYDQDAEIHFQSYGGGGICGNFGLFRLEKHLPGGTKVGRRVLFERKCMTGREKPRSSHKKEANPYDWEEEMLIWSYENSPHTPGGYT